MKQLQKSDLKVSKVYKLKAHNREYLYRISDMRTSMTLCNDGFLIININKFNKISNISQSHDFADAKHIKTKEKYEFYNATPEEKHWLEECIKANKFVSYEDAMKTFIPEYVECVIEYGLAKIGEIYKTSNNLEANKMFCLDWDLVLIRFKHLNTTFKPSTKEAYDAQFVVKEPKFEKPKYDILVSKENKYIGVQCSEGGVYKIGDKITVFDKISPNKGKPFTIKSFRWTNDKSKICAVTELHTPNGIGLDKIELYVEPKVKIAHNFKIGDKISIIKKPVKFSQPHYLDKIFIVEKIENNRLIINNETNDLHVSDKSVLAKNVKLIEAKQELSLLEQAKLKYIKGIKIIPIGAMSVIKWNSVILNHNIDMVENKSGIYIKGVQGWVFSKIRNEWAEIVEDFVLPENWHIKVTDDNKEILQQYIRNIHNSKKITLSNINYVAYSKWLNGVNKTENKLGYGLISHLNLNPLPDRFKTVTYYNGVEITFDQFKKYVLKNE